MGSMDVWHLTDEQVIEQSRQIAAAHRAIAAHHTSTADMLHAAADRLVEAKALVERTKRHLHEAQTGMNQANDRAANLEKDFGERLAAQSAQANSSWAKVNQEKAALEREVARLTDQLTINSKPARDGNASP